MAKKESRASGQVIPKGDGKWLVRVFLGRDGTGKRKYASETVTGTRSQADDALTLLAAKQIEGKVVAKTKLTLGDHMKAWIAGRIDIAAKTKMDYEHRMAKDLYLFPLAKKPLSSITKDDIQRHVVVLVEKRGLSPRTVKYSHGVIKHALDSAVDDNLIVKNPALKVNLPKAEHSEAPVLTPDQMQLFLERTALGDVQRHALWMILLTAGLRPQEALALKWDDITETDLGVWLTIQRALKKTGTSQWEIGEVKTKAGRRQLMVPQETWVALKAHRARQNSEILRAGSKYDRQGFVFASRKHNPGVFLDLGTARRWWKKALAAVTDEQGKQLLPVIKIYSARHSHATALLAGNVNPKIVQERLGHSKINVTLDTYSHVLPTMQREASEQIGTLLFKRTGT